MRESWASTKPKERVLHVALRVRSFMAIHTSCGSTFHHTAVTPGKDVSHASAFPVLANSFVVVGGLREEECFITGSAGTIVSRYPRWEGFWVAFHQLRRAGSVCRWQIYQGLPPPPPWSTHGLLRAVVPFLLFPMCVLDFVLAWLQAGNLLKDCEAPQSCILNLKVVGECLMDH